MRREGQELRILGRILGKCRVGYRDKTLKVIAGGLGTYIRLYLTVLGKSGWALEPLWGFRGLGVSGGFGV